MLRRPRLRVRRLSTLQRARPSRKSGMGLQLTLSAFGYVTGNQELQNKGNVQAEGAQWKHKQATSDAPVAVPVPSAEGIKGKVESAVGMATGDQNKQMEGNARAEKAAWKDGV